MCLNSNFHNIAKFGISLIAFSASLLAGCGGGGGGGTSGSNSAPATPTGIFTNTNGASVTLNWNAVSAATSYNIYSSMAPGVTQANTKHTVNNPPPYSSGQQLQTTVTANTSGRYYFAMTASNATGESPLSSEGSTLVTLPSDPKFYMTLANSSSLHAASTITGDWMTPTSLNGQGGAIAVNTTTKKAYVCTTGTNRSVQVVDTTTNAIVSTISLSALTIPSTITVDETRNLIYVSNSDGTISIINGATDTLVGYTTAITGIRAASIKANPATGTVYSVRNPSINVVMDIIQYNAVTNTYSNQTVDLPPNLMNGGPIDIDPTTNTIYAAASWDGLLVIDGATNTLTARIPLPGSSSADGVAISPATQKAYVVSESGGYLVVIDMATKTVLSTITLGFGANYIAINSASGIVGVSTNTRRYYQTYDPATNVLSAMHPTADFTAGMAASP